MLSSFAEINGFFGRNFETGRSFFFTTEALEATVRFPLSTDAVSDTSSRSIVLLKIERPALNATTAIDYIHDVNNAQHGTCLPHKLAV
jgi:hypothetical protein